MSKVSRETGLMNVFLVLDPPQFEIVIFIVVFCANGKMKCFINSLFYKILVVRSGNRWSIEE